jgi:hypothetical protein
MHQERNSSIRHIGRLLRLQYQEIADQPLPRRWVELINYLNEKERAEMPESAFRDVRDQRR